MKPQLATIANVIKSTLQPLTVEERLQVITSVMATIALPSATRPAPAKRVGWTFPLALDLSKEKIEEAIRNSTSLVEVTAKLGCSRRTLNNYMRKYELPYGVPGKRRKK